MLERQPDAVDQLRIKIVIAIMGMNSIEFVMFVSIVVRPLTLTFGGVIFPHSDLADFCTCFSKRFH